MSISSISSPSFYQQDQSYWSQANAQSQATSADAALINTMGTAEVNEAKGLASIANQSALSRVNSQISALVQQALGGSSSTSSSSTASSATGTSASAGSSGAPAVATGTVPLTLGTSLTTLGILQGGTITVSDGTNTTNYTSTGSDTVADLVNALNIDLPTNAQVTASLNNTGQLVITGRNDNVSVTVGGSGTDASVIGFGISNNTFQPTAPTPAASPSTGSTNSSSSSSSSSTSSSKALPSNLALAEQAASTASSILSADGVSGSLVDMLA